MKRNVYLKTTDLSTIQNIIHDMVDRLDYNKTEFVSIKDSLNRITSNPVKAILSSPFYSASAMDGVALDAKDTFSATEETPVRLIKDKYAFINTGDAIPPIYNCVVMIEDIWENEDNSITMNRSFKPYENVRPIGEDIVQGDVVLARNSKIRPIDISALLSAGLNEVEVFMKPKILILPTGDEIIRDINQMDVGKIIDSNSFYLKAEFQKLGFIATIGAVIPDQYASLEKAILDHTKEYDIVVIGAGSSAGSKDYAKTIIEEHGTVFAHGISIKPGKPTIIGEVNHTPIIGVPGYPVSTYITFEEVLKPLLLRTLHQDSPTPIHIKAVLATKVYSSLKHHEFVRMKVGRVQGKYIATPLSRKAGSTMSVVDADGILEIPKNSEGFLKNEDVQIRLLKDIRSINNSLVIIGSHDIILDIIHNQMVNLGYNISSSHVGSFSGVLAMKSRSAHLAPTHLLQEDGTYNVALLEKYLTKEYYIIKGVHRIQGWYVKKGNPKGFTKIEDLMREDIVMVNRQRGSGTRTLLDYHLAKKSIDSSSIKGYDFELSTHTLVANSVHDIRFDVGLGIESVARLNQLDFIPLAEEEYDFIIHQDDLEKPIVKAFIKVLQSDHFKEELTNLGGYKLANVGQIVGGKL